ncbi:hypothetical protein FHU23_001870 [Clostridium saccharobutylicum]|uniref:Uncharacterized protein n=1 Tax=Clostridium saccharobutylicum DSM 13864 TaxID=1345695 RepID=U5MW75_CLOSA|nr:hypothetical protein CLSA_c28990 [Clostridium saccharobutylicum DSM 13864]MBA2905178.1 hypothetical protein [Clostridium saccharobutylicum]MBA8789751.1 hypothetical protein [Clostridium saccharobutylicum]MBA8896447.1 hypothetical protein [Clostridium saccharobutylicum]MBA8983235.1 hypothetical protein [Clostridium saccharobutylicum]
MIKNQKIITGLLLAASLITTIPTTSDGYHVDKNGVWTS